MVEVVEQLNNSKIKWISHTHLNDLIYTVEEFLPGWWYSFSQRKGIFYMSLGPTDTCPDPESLYLASTREGDAGYHLELSLASYSDTQTTFNTLSPRVHDQISTNPFMEHVTGDILGVCLIKNEIIPTRDIAIRMRSDICRRHNSTDRVYIANAYENLVSYLAFLDRTENDTHIVQQIYVGSCPLSRGCSIRGVRSDGTAFDISCDMVDNSTIGHSITSATDMLKYYVKYNL